MKKQQQQAQAQAKAITSLDELIAQIEAPLKCRFKLDDTVLEIDVKRMPPAVAERQRAILRAVQPPFKKERNDFDMTDPDYLRKAAEAEDKARCIIVYFCCPIIAAKKACATDDEIVAFVKPLLTRNLQELIALTAQSGGLQLLTPGEAANFTGPGGSAS